MSTRDLQELCFKHGCFATEGQKELRRMIPSRYRWQILSDMQASKLPANAIETTALLGKDITRLGSRQGRSSQRWVFDAVNQRRLRLVTGCVPILQDGRILTISASRKSSWILPKGGWECDESMEESAVRESYEEAGVTGFLGSKLSEVTFEARKVKQQILLIGQHGQPVDSNDGEALIEPPSDDTSKFNCRGSGELSSSGSDLSHFSDDTSLWLPERTDSQSYIEVEILKRSLTRSLDDTTEFGITFDGSGTTELEDMATVSNLPIVSPAHPPFARVKLPTTSPCQLSFQEHEASGEAHRYTHIQMILFPLYVSEVLDDWPESGRLRRAVSIDEAIAMLAYRPEFHSALVEVKERGLHLHPG